MNATTGLAWCAGTLSIAWSASDEGSGVAAARVEVEAKAVVEFIA